MEVNELILYDSTFVYELRWEKREYIVTLIATRDKNIRRDVLDQLLDQEYRGDEIHFDNLTHLIVLTKGKPVFKSYNILSF